jgi:hypothetical protein
MKCSDIQLDLPLYCDNLLDESSDIAVRSHFEACPMCRQRAADYLEIRESLRRLATPAEPSLLQNRIKSSVRNQSKAGFAAVPGADIREWLTMRVMPYCVGFAASVVIGLAFLTMMFSGMLRPPTTASRMPKGESAVMLANSSRTYGEAEDPILPSEVVSTRLGYGPESPSINPSGALVELTRSLIKDGMKDDEVVVVADVYGNGLAQIAEVVEPSRDRQAILELQRALETDPSFTPFVPTNIEARPESVRVILKLQSVNVSTRDTGRRSGISTL